MDTVGCSKGGKCIELMCCKLISYISQMFARETAYGNKFLDRSYGD